MKTFLIPTTYGSDTRKAIEMAIDMFTDPGNRIVLFSVSDISDSITELLFLKPGKDIDISARQNILDFWESRREQLRIDEEIEIHHQYGLSRSTFNAIIERFNVFMAIVPESFQQSKQYIHQFTLRLLHRSNCPMMLLPPTLSAKGIQRALYLDKMPESKTAAVQHYPFHVIHKSMVDQQERLSLKSIIEEMHIDLIVKGKKIDSESATDQDLRSLGLPVLAV